MDVKEDWQLTKDSSACIFNFFLQISMHTVVLVFQLRYTPCGPTNGCVLFLHYSSRFLCHRAFSNGYRCEIIKERCNYIFGLGIFLLINFLLFFKEFFCFGF
ncbi:unnamed protein product [Meloidogyne enterolobii]|uniref:Uncharacterized protein n=1 Tax=Meloidogyne enterolobii TaxID=390850 RepID=A0ACB0XUX4_MELEN